MTKCELLSAYVGGRMTLREFSAACEANHVSPYELLCDISTQDVAVTLCDMISIAFCVPSNDAACVINQLTKGE